MKNAMCVSDRELHAILEHPMLLFHQTKDIIDFSYIMKSTAKQKQSQKAVRKRSSRQSRYVHIVNFGASNAPFSPKQSQTPLSYILQSTTKKKQSQNSVQKESYCQNSSISIEFLFAFSAESVTKKNSNCRSCSPLIIVCESQKLLSEFKSY
jgi:hypothetical protein